MYSKKNTANLSKSSSHPLNDYLFPNFRVTFTQANHIRTQFCPPNTDNRTPQTPQIHPEERHFRHKSFQKHRKINPIV